MKNKISEWLKEVEDFQTNDPKELENFRVKILGKKGHLAEAFAHFKSIPKEDKKEFGQLVNELKNKATEKVVFLKKIIDSSDGSKKTHSDFDLSLPVNFENIGSLHPLSIMRQDIIRIFERIGFNVSDGPEIEDDWHNFSALNFPEEHPARDMQDTFFIEKNPDIALRTHTSSVQVRVMESSSPPIRTISPGRVFRNEAISARAHCIFHQIEGLYIDTEVSFADLKQTLLYFAREMFGKDTRIRLRPSYFPFTEPSAEMDVSCNLCQGKGCNICKYTGWVEILGCGMVDPNVLDNCNIDSKKYSGFAFGMGVERMAMLKYQIKDLRLFFENDINFLKQFSSLLTD